MKYIIILLLSYVGFSQNSEDQKIMNLLLGSEAQNSIVYLKQSEGYDKIERVIADTKIFNQRNPSIEVILTEQELNDIKNSISENKTYTFPKNIFHSSEMLSKNNLASYSKRKYRKWRKAQKNIFKSNDSIKKIEFRNNRPYPCLESWVHFFSKPIYFRKETLCIIYFGKFCDFHSGWGGCDKVVIFNKQNDNWKQLIAINIGCY